MTFDISGRVVRWPDGSDGVIQQEDFTQDQSAASRRAYVARLRIKREAKPDITGALRFTAEAHKRMPGRNDAEKANAVALKLVSRIALHGLDDGFFFRVEADDLGIEVVEA
jgi:hypothetical protein